MTEAVEPVEHPYDLALREWCRSIANTLGLSEWAFHLEYDESLPDDVYARVKPAHARQAATIIVGKEFAAATPEEKRATIVHEFLHCHLAQSDEVIHGALPELLGVPAFNAFLTGYDLSIERAVEGLAVPIARLLPLPPPEGE